MQKIAFYDGQCRRHAHCLTKTLLIMKLAAVLLFAASFNVSAKGFSQNISFSGREVGLEQVISAVEKQSGYVFMYTESIVKSAQPVTITARNVPVLDFLSTVFKAQPVDYYVKGKTVFLSRKQPGAFPFPVAENGTEAPRFEKIIVRVIDTAGKAIAGVSVSGKDGKLLGVTDNEGSISLDLKENNVLVISSVGFESVVVKITAAQLKNGSILLALKPAVEKLDEVEVTVNNGYQSLPKERATGSFGIVTAKQLAQTPVVSVLERLQGLVPGMDISTKTTAGKSRNGSVVIRGLSTIKSSYTKVSTDPLLVIDGFPSQISISNGALDLLNPEDIEQVTILKDAAAASIWGIQAANGVIVIVTKKGRKNTRTSFNFSTTLGTSKKPGVDYGNMLSMPEYIELEKELIEKGRLFDPVLSTSSFFPENNSQAQAIIFSYKRGAITEDQMNQQLEALSKVDNSQQMSDLLLQSPTTRQYNLSLSGGGPNNSYYVSGYFYTDDRVYRSNRNKGYSLKASNIAGLFNNRITVTTDLLIGNTRDKINNAAVKAMSIGSGGIRPYDELLTSDGQVRYYDLLVTPNVARNLESKGYLPFRYSPVDELNYSNTNTNTTNLALNVAVNAKLTSWLSANASGNIGRYFSESELYWEPDSYDARMMVNVATSLNATGGRVYGLPTGGKLDQNNGQGRTYSLRGQLVVDKVWNDRHRLNMLAGTEIREKYDKTSGEVRYGYDRSINSFRSVSSGTTYRTMYNSSQTISATSKAITELTTRSLSHFANAAYTYDDKYTVSASARFDDFNLLGVDRRKRAIPLWSAGAKWNLKKERFLENVSWIDQLGARMTYGISGNAPQGYAPVTVVFLASADFYTGYPYAIVTNPAVDNLAWEKTRMVNYGIDYSFFGNRVSGSVEFYRKKTTDIIWQLPINSTYGFSTTLFNTANLTGKGVDISLNVVPVSRKNFRWTAFMNLSYNTNVVKDARFNKATTSFTPEILYDGYPSDYLFSYWWAGLDNTGQSLIRDPQKPDKTYNVLEFPFENIRVYSGRTTSPWFGGFGSSFEYKGLSLSCMLQYKFGGVFRMPSINNIGFSNNLYVGRMGDLSRRWRKPGDEAITNVPGLEFGANTVFNQSVTRYSESTYLIRSKSSIHLQQVSLAYSVPKQLIAKAGMKGLIISAVARNLGMIWAKNKENMNPDYLPASGGNYQLPPVTNFTFTVGVNF